MRWWLTELVGRCLRLAGGPTVVSYILLSHFPTSRYFSCLCVVSYGTLFTPDGACCRPLFLSCSCQKKITMYMNCVFSSADRGGPLSHGTAWHWLMQNQTNAREEVPWVLSMNRKLNSGLLRSSCHSTCSNKVLKLQLKIVCFSDIRALPEPYPALICCRVAAGANM